MATTFCKPTTLKQAVEKLRFVQADPIRSPARAQDLILRHRVTGYRAGDLERHYAKLGLHEAFLYAYGFTPEATWRLLHAPLERSLSRGEQRVLELVRAAKGPLHPRALDAQLGRARELNAWGGYSKVTTQTLQLLHHGGWLRVAGREKGIRLYEQSQAAKAAMEPRERLRQLILLVAGILAPIPERSLRATLQLLTRKSPALEGRHAALNELMASGELAQEEVGGVRYLWTGGALKKKRVDGQVRFLTPFDPLVWDRRRFEHFWGWAYRFEAYTPAAKRKLGYYAMPLLWRGEVVGWVNLSAKGGANLEVEAGYVEGQQPKESGFQQAFEEEVERVRRFLKRRTQRK